MSERVQRIIAERQSALKKQIPRRVWLCGGCGHVMGVFSEDYGHLVIDTARVNLMVSGGNLKRKCHRCDTENDIATREKGQTIVDWLNDHSDKVAPFKNPG